MSRRNEWNNLIFDVFRKAKSYFNNFYGGVGQKWMCPFKSRNSEICCMTRVN